MELHNFKILVFSGQETIYPILDFLNQKKLLGGVAFDKGDTPQIQHLQQNLASIGLPMLNYLPTHMAEVKAKIAEFDCDVALVFGFSHILPKEIIDLFSRGVYNIHPSALPYYKGPQPLFWQIKNNEQKTALTLHQVTENVDSGDIIKILPFDISPFDIYGSLVGEVLKKSIELIQIFIDKLANSKTMILQGTPQKKLDKSSCFPRAKLEDVQIDWEKMSSDEISCLSRAGQGHFHGAHTQFNGALICIQQISKSSYPTYNVPAGTILNVDENDGLIVALKDEAICIDIIFIADGTFSGANFALKYNIEAGMKLE